jgi:hypothetical protein
MSHILSIKSNNIIDKNVIEEQTFITVDINNIKILCKYFESMPIYEETIDIDLTNTNIIIESKYILLYFELIKNPELIFIGKEHEALYLTNCHNRMFMTNNKYNKNILISEPLQTQVNDFYEKYHKRTKLNVQLINKNEDDDINISDIQYNFIMNINFESMINLHKLNDFFICEYIDKLISLNIDLFVHSRLHFNGIPRNLLTPYSFKLNAKIYIKDTYYSADASFETIFEYIYGTIEPQIKSIIFDAYDASFYTLCKQAHKLDDYNYMVNALIRSY